MVDLNTSIAKAAGGGGGDMLSRLQYKLKSSDGKSYGDFFPEVAPLVFPSLDQLASAEDTEKKISKTKQRQQFVSEYLDRRAQATFVSVFTRQSQSTDIGANRNNSRGRKTQTVS